MSECVVRMKMPKSCDACPCLDDYGDYPRCRISGEQRGYNFPIHEKRMPNCPIICQLPEGHGRLVDINIVAKRIKDAEELSEFCDEFEFGGRWTVDLSKIPTIVPAERSEV